MRTCLSAVLSAAIAILSATTPALAQTPRPASVRLTLDAANAELTIKALGEGLSPDEVEQFRSAPSTGALVRRATGWQLQLTPDDLLAMIEKAKVGEAEPFTYAASLTTRDDIIALTSRVVTERAELESYLSEHLGPYLEPGEVLPLNLIMLVGGRSAGFTFGDAQTMYVGLQFYQGDFLGFRNMLLHEAFHNVQASRKPAWDLSACLTEREQRAHDVLETVFREGTAEFVADIWEYGDESRYTARQRAQAKINQDEWRLQNVGKLIDFMVVNAMDGSGEADPEVLDVILTDWNWNNPGYFYGYRAAKALTRTGGPTALRPYLEVSPAVFFRDYARLTGEGSPPNSFSPRFLEVVDQLAAKVAACPITTT